MRFFAMFGDVGELVAGESPTAEFVDLPRSPMLVLGIENNHYNLSDGLFII